LKIAFEVVGDFRDYTTGVYSSPLCKNGPSDVNHAVLAVGYGVDNGVNYWIVKNSWGADWGQAGYIWMSRNLQNQCGIATDATYPTV